MGMGQELILMGLVKIMFSAVWGRFAVRGHAGGLLGWI